MAQSVSVVRNLVNDKIQLYNFNLEQMIIISVKQLISRNNTIYIYLQNQGIQQVESNFSFKVENMQLYLIKISFAITQDNQINSENIVIRTCCNQIHEFPIIVFFKYLYEEEQFFIIDDIMKNIYIKYKEIFFLFCWSDSNIKQYFRYQTLLYARIYSEEELQIFYQLERQDVLDKFNFTIKELAQPINRETEICLVLYKNQFTTQRFQKIINLDNEKQVQVIDLDILYETILLSDTQDKIIQVKLFQDEKEFYINEHKCFNPSQYYSSQKITKIETVRHMSDYEQVTGKYQIIVINQKVKITKVETIFEINSSEWIIFEIEQMIFYQLTSESLENNFQVGYQLSSYGLLSNKCTEYNQNLNSKYEFVDGVLTQENNIIKNTNFEYLYLKVSSGFNIEKIQFKLRYYNQIELINKNSNTIIQKTLSYYQFDKKYQMKIFKIVYSNMLNFYISKCQLHTKSVQQMNSNTTKDDSQNNLYEIQYSYIFIYPEICVDQFQEDFQNQPKNFKQDEFCLQINQKQNSDAVIQEENEQINIQKLELNQVFSIQMNSLNKYIILEVENKYCDYHLYLEYQSIEDHPVFFEIRYLVNNTFLQSFSFQQYQEIKVFQLQNLKYLEIYNYNLNTSFDLILVISKQQFFYSNIYQNKLKLKSGQGPSLLLLSRFENQNIIVNLQNSQNETSYELSEGYKSPKNVYIFSNKLNYTIREIYSQKYLKKQMYFLEVLENNVSISIHKTQYFIYENTSLSKNDSSSLYQFSQTQNIFKFKIDILQVQSIYGFSIQNLKDQHLYYIYSNNQIYLQQQFINGINPVEQNQNIVIFKEKVLEIKQIEGQYEITTSLFQKSYVSIQKNTEQHQYFQIYLLLNSSSMIIPISQIFQQPAQKMQNRLEKFEQQILILNIILLMLLLLICLFFFKLKNLKDKIKVL
ncbi:hypothetical protein ABPG73_003935 [Tetrahymena malaccensis]